MANKLHSLSELFTNRIFRIPDYQRGYAWKNEQLTDFWEDLLNLNEERYHYTGLLSLKAIHRREMKLQDGDDWLLDDGYKPFHVVDGQQRLTTFSILMYEIIKLIRNLPENTGRCESDIILGSKYLKDIRQIYIERTRPPHNIITTYLFGYESDNPSADYLKYKIFEQSFGGAVVETYYTKNLKNAKYFFAENLQKLYEDDGIAGIEKLYRKLTQKLMFNLHEIEDDYDVFVAFETMNNRGKRLTNLELLKNRLIYLTTLFEDDQLDRQNQTQLRKQINDAWKEVYYQLGRNQNSPLSDDDYLRAHWIAYFQYSRKDGNDYIRFLLDEKFSPRNVYDKHTIIDIENEIAILSDLDIMDSGDTDEVDQPKIRLVSKLTPKDIKDYIDSLKLFSEFWYYSYFPYESDFSNNETLWLDRLNRIGIAYFRPLVVAAMSVSASTSIQRIALYQAIERFIFIGFRLSNYNFTYQSSVYYRKAREVLKGTVSLASVCEDLKTLVTKDRDYAIRTMLAHSSRRFASGTGFYGWKGLRYFLYEYEYEKSVQNNISKVDWNMFTRVEKDKVSIEHILPQTPTKEYWKSMYSAFSDEEVKILSASLGNLLPLSQSVNSSLQNDSFQDKKSSGSNGRRGYSNGSHSEIEVSQEKNWTAQHIRNRGLVLLDFMEKRWDVGLTDNQKLELLSLGFLDHRPDSNPLQIPEADVAPVGIQSHEASPTLERSLGTSKSEKSKISKNMIICAYTVAKKVHNGMLGREEGAEKISNDSGMSKGSASDYITIFLAMMEGREYQRTMKIDATRYFLDQIQSDYGMEAHRRALESCKKHVAYYNKLGNGNLSGLQQIIEESV